MTSKENSVDVLGPIEYSDFFSTYWEKTPLHISRKDNNPHQNLITVEALEHIISTNSLHFPQLQLSKSGTSLSSNQYSDETNTIVPLRVSEHIKAGATAILSHAENLHSPLLGLCRHMQKLFLMPCQTNVYYSPAGMQGFNPHYDTHDVFILQVSGGKTFRFYSERTMFPTVSHRFDKEKHNTGTETEQISLQAGDTLYIPRGVVHDAAADDHQPSLHITLGVYPVLYSDLLHDMIDVACEDNHQLRRAISQTLWSGEEQPSNIPDELATIASAIFNQDNLMQSLDQIRDRVAIDSLADISGMIGSTPVEDANSFSVRHDRIMHVEERDQATKLRLFGAVIEFEPKLTTALHWILAKTQFDRTDVPKAQEQALLSLLEQLKQHGVIECEI